jgi:hypothetical protein
MHLANRTFLGLYAQLETHYRFNLGSDHGRTEREPVATHVLFGTGVMPPAVYRRCRRLRPWSPSHAVVNTKQIR